MAEPREWAEYKYVEVAKTVYRKHPPELIRLDQLDEWRSRQPKDADLYSSVYRFSNNEDPYIGGGLAGLLLDLDEVEKPDRARREAVAVVKYLMDRFRIPEAQIRIAFSGSKGVHVVVNRRTFDISPSNDLPLILKSMAEELRSELGLKTLDPAVFDIRRLWRLGHTKHRKSGLFKNPLTLSELESLSWDQIRAMAIKPRDLPPPSFKTFNVVPEARDWYLSHVDKVRRWREERKEEFKPDELKALKEVPPCVAKRLQIGCDEGMRNDACFRLAVYFANAGETLENARKQIHGFNRRCRPPLPEREVDAAIESAWQGVHHGKYSVGCSTTVLADLCDKPACPFFQKQKKETVFPPEIIAKALGVLEKQDPFSYVTDVAALIHSGDEDAVKGEWTSGLSATITKTPINTHQIGGSAKGKSHLKYSILQLYPEEYYQVFTSASPKSLFYYVKEYGEYALDKMLLFVDEVEASKDTLPILRSLTGQTDITPRHLSVFETELLDLKIKGRRAVWFTSVKTFGTEQIKNRFIHMNPDETAEQDERVFQLQDQLTLEDLGIPEEPFQVARAITKTIVENTRDIPVYIPWQIEWPFKQRRYLYPFFISFIKVIAKARFKQRRINDEGYLVPEAEDFELAKKIWRNFGDTIIYRVSAAAENLLEHIPELPGDALTHSELTEHVALSTRQIERLCAELLDGGLINRRKRAAERGRQAWEYWRAKLPTVEDIEIAGDRDFHQFKEEVMKRWKVFEKYYQPTLSHTQKTPLADLRK